jgi:SAM-dependent methyltransferase
MEQSEDAKLVNASAARLYGAGQEIWDPKDRWNSRKRKAIDSFARKFAVPGLSRASVIMDIGSGSQPYGWLPSHTISLDRFWGQVRHHQMPVVGDMQRLPFRTAAADYVVCVASVLNYAPAAEAIAELSRVLKPGGNLLLHFETSTSFEHLGTGRWGAAVIRIATENGGRDDTLWVYRPSYIRALLQSSGFRLLRQHRFHIASALALRLGLRQQQAAPFSTFDWIFAPATTFSDDVILIAERAGGARGEGAGEL